MKKHLIAFKLFLIIGLGYLLPSVASYPFPVADNGVKKVVIDAGHGGKDPGNLGTGRYKKSEKDIALNVARLVGSYIKDNFEDVEVVYTRKSDYFLELHERTALANNEKADLFISIHCDSYTNPNAHGCASYVMGTDKTGKNMRVAMQENSVIYLEDNFEEQYEGFDPSKPETYIALSLYQNAFLEQSIDMAQKVQDQFRERAKRKDRGVKHSPFYVVSRTLMPSLLIELGFLTNQTEENYLHSQQGQEYMASAIYRAFKEYKSERDNIDALNQLTKEAVEPELTTIETPEKAPVTYRVQIATSGRLLELTPQNFKGLKDIQFIQKGGLYKYTYGDFDNLDAANEALKEARKSGFEDAFIVGVSEGEIIPAKAAMEQNN